MATTRRTILVGFAPVVLATGCHAAPAASITLLATPHLDAELLDLGRRWTESHAAFNAAIDRVGELENVGLPEPPAAIFVADGDRALKLAGYASDRADGRRWYCVEAVDAERRGLRRKHWRWQRREVRPDDNLPDDATHIDENVPWMEAQTRADEIVAAYDAWQVAKKAARDASGCTAAEAEMGRLSEIDTDIEDAIEAMTPRTLAGLAVQARVILAELNENRLADDRETTVLRGFVSMMGGAA